jgi:AbrB family looped-hinge helix DNA binding protein
MRALRALKRSPLALDLYAWFGTVMRVTSKGQVTIPVGIREQMGIQPHTEVRFVVWKGRVVLEKATSRGTTKRPTRGEAIVARLRNTARRATMSTDELMALTRCD